MDEELIRQKLESLRRCVGRIEDRCPDDPETLVNDPDLQDILTVNLTRAVHLCADVAAHCITDLGTRPPDSMGEVFTALAGAGLLSDALVSQNRCSARAAA